MAPILGIYASQISGHLWAPSGAYDSIASTTIGAGGASSVTFNSIPQGYTHLQVRVHGMFTAINVAISFRVGTGGTPDTTTSNYYYHRLTGDGATASAGAGADIPQSAWVIGNNNTAHPEVFVADILDYRNTNKNKTIRMLSGVDSNGVGEVDLTSGLWRNTGAIDVIQMVPNTGNFAQHASFALYGIKGN